MNIRKEYSHKFCWENALMRNPLIYDWVTRRPQSRPWKTTHKQDQLQSQDFTNDLFNVQQRGKIPPRNLVTWWLTYCILYSTLSASSTWSMFDFGPDSQPGDFGVLTVWRLNPCLTHVCTKHGEYAVVIIYNLYSIEWY